MAARGVVRLLTISGVAGTLLALGGCVVAPPPGPSIAAMPPEHKPFEVFQQDDAACREFAATQTGIDPAQAATQSQVNSAVVGTVLGAGLGAAIGAAAGNPALGAAIGAGSGALLGTAQGASAGAYAGATVQQRYDIGYAQCMVSKGNTVPAMTSGGYPPQLAGFPSGAPFPYAYGGYPYAYGYGYPYAYPYAYGPAFVGGTFFVGGGGGHGNFHHGHW